MNSTSTISQKVNTSDSAETIARLGMATKGIIYTLVGALTVMSAIGMGGKKSGKSGTLEYIAGQSYGQIILVILAVGLAGYVFYRLYQVIVDPSDEGTDAKGIGKRLAYAGSAVLYGFLSYKAISIVSSASGSSGSGGSGGNEGLVATLLNQPFGQILVGIVGVIFLVKAGAQLYRAYSGSFKKKVESAGLDRKAQSLILKSGRIGYTARGIVIAVISYMILKAAFTANSSQAGGTQDAFSYIQNEFGTIVMIILAAGILAYGVFTFIRAKYPGVALTK